VRFVRLDTARTYHGTGAGLGRAIVKGIVEAHGGEVWAEDAGPGTRFVVQLPGVADRAATEDAGAPLGAASPPTGMQGGCGLVIDRDHNAALNLAALVAVTGSASGAATDQRQLVNAQGEAKFMATARCASLNCEDGSGQPGKAATAAEQSTAA
jgi:hypothetical protein